MKYKNNLQHISKGKFSPDLKFEGEGFSFLYSYIRKNASTSFKLLFKHLHPDLCHGEVPSISCMAKHVQVESSDPDKIDSLYATKIFVYRDPVERVFSVYKNKLIQKDGAVDILGKLEQVIGRDPALLTFDEFVNEYVALLQGERWQDVDGHLYPQTWHLLPITYTKAIHINNVYQEMQGILPKNLCNSVFKEPSNSTTKGSVALSFADSDCPAIYFRKKYLRDRALPALNQVLTPATEVLLREIYADDYQMIEEVEGNLKASITLNELPATDLSFELKASVSSLSDAFSASLDFSIPENTKNESKV
ncbi:sulfotransferase family 2 domain-containing protein [Vreelandella piezotolerans]|uniref:sulfotransferase family 2 domain-containing protein n=1 Tax=Vreelandella piezotolerans TaxID=2609667 RepID=UPI00379B2CA1